MEQNQNKEQLQPEHIPDSEVLKSFENTTTEISPIAPNIKGQTSTYQQAETQNSKPETESMEVHKHPHHVMHSKKWNEYLLEFFMLFLAVFLGFIAENIREKISEHEHEKKYAEHLLLDLKGDSAIIQKHIKEFQQRQKNQVYFFKTMSAAVKPSDSTVISGFLVLFTTWNLQFTTATYNQMKTSGSLRYIRNDEITSELQKYYDVLLPQTDKEVTDIRKVFTDLIAPYMVKHFRFQDFQDLVPARYSILDRTSNSDQELINIMGVYGGGWDTVLDEEQKNLKQTLKLIGMIKKEYGLE